MEKSLRRALYNMLIGLEITNPKERKENGVQVRFKLGFNLDPEDRQRITMEREKDSLDLEKFEKSYNKNLKKKADAARESEEEAAAEETAETPAAPSEENAGMPSIAMTPPELREKPEAAETDASDET